MRRGPYNKEYTVRRPVDILEWNRTVWEKFMPWLRKHNGTVASQVRRTMQSGSVFSACSEKTVNRLKPLLLIGGEPEQLLQAFEDVRGVLFRATDLTELPAYEWWARYHDAEEQLHEMGPRIKWRAKFEIIVPE